MFQDAPPVPPSHSQALSAEGAATGSAPGPLQSIGRMLRRPGFVLLVLTYGISVGVFYAISTVLNVLISTVFPVSGRARR